MADDASPSDATGSFTYSIDWDGNGTLDETIQAGATVDVDHVFPATVADKDDSRSLEANIGVIIDIAQIGDGLLLIGGTIGHERVSFRQLASFASLYVWVNAHRGGTIRT